MIYRLIFCIALSTQSIVGVDVRDDLPQEASSRIHAYREAAQKIVKESSGRLQKERILLLELFTADLKQLSADVKLDEAIEIRNLLRRLDQATSAEAKEQVLRDANLQAKTNSQNALLRFQQLELTERVERDKSLTEIRRALLQDLNKLMEQFAKTEKLDEAVSVREQIRSLQLAAADAPVAASRLDDGMTVDEAARVRFQKAEELQQVRNLETKKELAKLVEKLASEQDKSTRAGNLDCAVAIRDLVNRLKQIPQGELVIASLTNERSKLSGEAIEAMEAFKKTFDASAKRLTESIGQLDREYAPFEAIRVRAQLKNKNSLEAASILSGYYRLLGTQPDWFSRNKPLPPLSKLAESLFDHFELASQSKLAEANQKEKQARGGLVMELAQSHKKENRNDAEQVALEELIEFFEASHAEGLRGLMLLEIPADLSAEDRGRVSRFQREMRELTKELRRGKISQIERLRSEIEPLIDQHLEKNQFPEVYAIICKFESLSPLYEPIPIRIAMHPGFPIRSEALLLEVRGNAYLVRMQHGAEEWLPKAQVSLDGKVVEKVADFHPSLGHRFAPGEEVSANTKLKKGQKGFCFWGSRWYPITIQDIAPTGVLIRWDGYTEAFDKMVQRNELRILDDD